MSRDDRTTTAACRLRTATDRFQENLNIDISQHLNLSLRSIYIICNQHFELSFRSLCTHVLSCVFAVFVLCWSPYFVFNLLDVFEVLPAEGPRIVPIRAFVQAVAPLNSAVNPIIYGIFSTRICNNLRYSIQFYSIQNSLFSTQHIVHTIIFCLHTMYCKGSEQRQSLRVLVPNHI